jgi:hypothetical protein
MNPRKRSERRSQTGRYRSGQTGQTVNLLALRLRWFESSPAQLSFLDLGKRSFFGVGFLVAATPLKA